MSELTRLLERAQLLDSDQGVGPHRFRRTPHEAAQGGPPVDGLVPGAPGFEVALAELRASHPDLHANRVEELVYLANVLMADSQCRRRRLRPVEALEAAVAVTNLGLEQALAAKSDQKAKVGSLSPAAAGLVEATADQLFRRGWRALRRCRSQRPNCK